MVHADKHGKIRRSIDLNQRFFSSYISVRRRVYRSAAADTEKFCRLKEKNQRIFSS